MKSYLKLGLKLDCSAEHKENLELEQGHYVKFALGDPKEICFLSKCDGDHIICCGNCVNIYQTIHEIVKEVDGMQSVLDEEDYEDLIKLDAGEETKTIVLWWQHIPRSVQQNKAKLHIVTNNLDSLFCRKRKEFPY